MGKKTKAAKKPPTSVKLQNKSLNKVHKRNKQTKVKRKEMKNSLKGTNLSLALQRSVAEKEENDFENGGEEEEEVLPTDMMDDDTLQYFSSNFEKKQQEKKNKNKSAGDFQLEDSYTPKAVPKKEEKGKPRKQLLPIKGETGLIEQYMDIQEAEPVEEKKKHVKQEEPRNQKPVSFFKNEGKSAVELLLEKKKFVEMTKDKIGLLSRGVISNPQGELKKLRELRTMLTQPDVLKFSLLKKLLMVSLTEIFKDIIPGYKIRVWSEKENEQQISKEVKELKDYEHNLVKQYRLFIEYLDSCIRETQKKKNGLKEQEVSVAIQAANCLSDLVQKASHFNHAIDIISILVFQTASKFQQISEICCECVKKLFVADNELSISLEIMKKISKLLKQRSFGVKAEVLNTMLALNIKEIKIVDDGKKKLNHKEKMKLSRADRKKLKEKEQLEFDLDQRKLSDRLHEKSKLQTQILEQMFLVYFKILKTNANLKLIPCVLEGLSKFAHLISLDYFEDLVTIMHDMIQSETLPFRAKLHCIKTVFIVLSGQGEALTIDPLRFYTNLYNIILQLNAAGNFEDTLLFVECIDMMFFRRRKQIPPSRLMAFVKRLSTITLQLDPKSCALIQHTIRKLINLSKTTELLFDIEYQFNGIFNPELPEPDYANAQNSALWELHLLTRHYDSSIVDISNHILQQNEFTTQHSKITNDFIIHEFVTRENAIIVNHNPPYVKHKNDKKKKGFIKKNKNKNKKQD